MEKRFLLLDDDKTFNLIHKKIIKDTCPGAKVQMTNSISGAIQILKKDNNYTNNIVLVDYELGQKTAFDFLDAFHYAFEYISPYEIFVMSTFFNEDQRQNFKKINMSENLLLKPLDEVKIKNIIRIAEQVCQIQLFRQHQIAI